MNRWESLRKLLRTRQLDEDMGRLFAKGMFLYLTSSSPLKLDRCLGIPQQATTLKQIRNLAMRDLADVLSEDYGGVNLYGIAGVMLDEIRAFRHTKLQSYLNNGLPVIATTRQRLLFEIFTLGHVPNNRNTVYAILQDVDGTAESFDIEDHVDDIEDEIDRTDSSAASRADV